MSTETAYAKINLALHVRSRRDDGYHELETLFAFVDAGDVLTARAAAADSLQVTGEFAPSLTNPFGNIVAQALTALPHTGGMAVTLEKNLPVAAGLYVIGLYCLSKYKISRESHEANVAALRNAPSETATDP